MKNTDSVQQVQWMAGKEANTNQLACQLKQINTILFVATLLFSLWKRQNLISQPAVFLLPFAKPTLMLSYHELHFPDTSCWITGLRHILI